MTNVEVIKGNLLYKNLVIEDEADIDTFLKKMKELLDVLWKNHPLSKDHKFKFALEVLQKKVEGKHPKVKTWKIEEDDGKYFFTCQLDLWTPKNWGEVQKLLTSQMKPLFETLQRIKRDLPEDLNDPLFGDP